MSLQGYAVRHAVSLGYEAEATHVIWSEFEAAAPEVARLGAERLLRTGLAIVATIRRDGTPRIDPVEPFFSHGHLLLGMMRSQKAFDLLRDPRCLLHNPISDPNGSEGEFKLRGRAVDVQGANLWEGYRQAYADRWKRRPPEGFPFRVFSLDIDSAALIRWDIEKGEMIIGLWSLAHGVTETRRKYP